MSELESIQLITFLSNTISSKITILTFVNDIIDASTTVLRINLEFIINKLEIFENW